MLPYTNTNSDTPLYLQIVNQLRDMILNGELPDGFKIPSERRMAELLGVHRNTIKRAYNEWKKSVDPKKISKSEKKKSKVKKKAGAQGIVVKEVKISGSLTEAAGVMDSRRGQMAEDAQALDQAEESNPKSVFLAAFTSALAFCFGGVLRLSRFLKEV